MKNDKCNNFGWGELVKRIKRENVIPVIGHGLYRVEIEGKGEVFLYDYLAEQMLAECNAELKPDENHKFAKACFEFLKKYDQNYLKLSDFLKEKLDSIQLVHDNSLKKLARIKKFNIFINTAYDNFLIDTIRAVRTVPTEVLYYTARDKEFGRMESNLFNSLKNSQCTVVYQIFGNMNKNIASAFTERDILETIMQFNKDTISEAQVNRLFWKLEKSSLLFIGCGFDDWLFRFFIRTVASESYESLYRSQNYNFVGDVFRNKRDPDKELPRFLKNHKAEIFHSSGGSDFVDLLFEKVEGDSHEEIIHSNEFPCAVLISFEGTDRDKAKNLVENLKEDGINVWFDEIRAKGGDEVDKTIFAAIDNCTVFISLISEHSRQIQTDKGKLKYHIREWERAYGNMITHKNVTIIPVIIDDTKWMYDKFEPLFHLKISGGGRVGNYEKLRDQLKGIRKENQD